ncbi:IS66 family insertion sequence element accessory protein TnpA [Pseudoalteromonas sp. '520P1 No. 412']
MKYQQKIKHWQSLFIQQQNSGLSISDFCKQQQFATSTFSYSLRTIFTF